MALAFLNDQNDAEYEIFKDYSGQSLRNDIPNFKEDDLLLFGSFYALNPALRPQLVKYLKKAHNQGAIILYDPNYRNHHAHRVEESKKMIEENFSLAHIVRGSDEDFKNIFGLNTLDEMATEILKYCPNVIITSNSNGVYLYTKSIRKKFPALTIKPVSTIGAGDNFNAGLIYGILQENIVSSDLNYLSEKEWSEIIALAVAFSSTVCCSIENYVPTNFSDKITQLTNDFFAKLK